MVLTIFVLVAVASLVMAATPDREPRPNEWGYRPPDGSKVSINPPSLTWVHNPEASHYIVQLSRTFEFRNPITIEKVRWCVYTHHEPLKPGTYFWRYRFVRKDGSMSEWSKIRRFVVSTNAVIFPQPTLDELKKRIPKEHPRLFLRPEEIPQLREWAKGEGRKIAEPLLREAERLLKGEPTPEPSIRASLRDPQTRKHWWPNREQTLKACMEAETLALAYLLTGEKRFGEAARRWILHLASWDPDGPTNFNLNCEAAKPMLHRLPRAYDWAYDVLTEEEREKVRQVMRRRALDAWRSWEVREGNGHLNAPYDSHGNRTWHKLAECAIAFLGEIPEAETWLDYAVNKFFAAYPVWSDDDGGWHEGLSYWAGYMGKFIWWAEVAEKALSIDSFRKPFFANVGNYALYTAPPGSPDMGFGDLSHGRPSSGWSFVPYFAIKTRNPYLAWWAEQWRMSLTTNDPIIYIVFGRLKPIAPKPPTDLSTSKVFHGIGVAILNSNLLSSAENVQVRFKSSPFGRQSHGHDPHNSFTLNAYGDALLVNCVYRDWHGSPFHTQWCWSTKAHNALLVNGEGQKPHSPDPFGKIVAWDFQGKVDYVAGDATDAYEGKLKRFIRHIVFVKPDVIVIADEVVASKPSTFQWMLHGLSEFVVNEPAQMLTLERERAGLLVHYIAPEPLRFRQWSGYEPKPDIDFMGGRTFPTQWHLEASTTTELERVFTLTVLRPYRKGERLERTLSVEQNETAILLKVPCADGRTVTIALRRPDAKVASVKGFRFTNFAMVDDGDRRWRLGKVGN
ncbi:MAG: DUF4962 domain-containing protein [Armatimonadetes bacterium]|nr:DUF4962 domain-containing protein [Armatimonadota bacterium]MDW8026884.1 DUF4962 domain-containing protein [Armatimonadota bacterium]